MDPYILVNVLGYALEFYIDPRVLIYNGRHEGMCFLGLAGHGGFIMLTVTMCADIVAKSGENQTVR